MWNWITSGAALMWLLGACGVLAFLVFVDRIVNLHRAQIVADDFLKGVYNILNRDNTVEAATICEETPGPVARLALAALPPAERAALLAEAAPTKPDRIVSRAVVADRFGKTVRAVDQWAARGLLHKVRLPGSTRLTDKRPISSLGFKAKSVS